MGATYPFITLTVHDGGDIFRLTSFSGPSDIKHLLTRDFLNKRRSIYTAPIGYSYPGSQAFDSLTGKQGDPSKTGSRLVAIKVWSHKYLHGIQLVYRKPKPLHDVPVTAEELWKKLDKQNQEEPVIMEDSEQEQVFAEDRQKEEVAPDAPEREIPQDERYWTTDVYGSDSEDHSVLQEFYLGDNEYLTGVEIDYSAILMCIRLTSSTGRNCCIGTPGGTTYKFSAFPATAIVAFHGLFGVWGDHGANHIHRLGVITEEIDPEISGDCEVLRMLGNYTYRLKEVIPMNDHQRFYIFKFQDLDDRSIQRKECLV